MCPAEPAATWADFSAAFHLHHILEGLMDRKREEFCAFTQGKLTVDAYSRELGNLARYGTEEVSTDAKKPARFRKGLSPELRRDLCLHVIPPLPLKLPQVARVASSDTKHPPYLILHPCLRGQP